MLRNPGWRGRDDIEGTNDLLNETVLDLQNTPGLI